MTKKKDHLFTPIITRCLVSGTDDDNDDDVDKDVTTPVIMMKPYGSLLGLQRLSE